MTSAAATLFAGEARSHAATWRASALEFSLVGGLTLLLFPLAWCGRALVGADDAELAIGFLTFHAAYLINDPHFAVTYLLFYRNVKERAFGRAFSTPQRLRYLIAGAVVPFGLAAWAITALATGSARALGLLFELMFLLVGWHYVKQGFGVLSVLSARRGVAFDLVERRVILAHCFAAWAHAWANPASQSKLVEEKGVVYTALAHPRGVEAFTFALFSLSTLALGAVLFRKWRREGRLPPLGALGGFLITVWLWTVYTSVEPLMVYVIPALHSLQYLYFVWLLKRNEARAEEGPPDFGRPVAVRLGLTALSALALGFVLFHGAPELLDARVGEGVLGPTPYFACLFAFVNIHHYFMDHVIWRRENPELRHLRA
jgi:hypothetical protein